MRARHAHPDALSAQAKLTALNKGSFEWPRGTTTGTATSTAPLKLTVDQFNALVLGLPWQRLEQLRRITRM